jgi:hypothetical protein
MSKEILEDLTYNFNKLLTFNSATLNEDTFTSIKVFEELPNKDKQE